MLTYLGPSRRVKWTGRGWILSWAEGAELKRRARVRVRTRVRTRDCRAWSQSREQRATEAQTGDGSIEMQAEVAVELINNRLSRVLRAVGVRCEEW